MALKKIPYQSIDVILKKHLDDNESSYTAYLLNKIRAARKKGYLTKEEFILICNWKSPRSLQLVKQNTSNKIKSITKSVITSKDEGFVIKQLIKLKGVSIAMASALLMFLNPKKYPVIDIRVWQVLYELNLVTSNTSGKSLSINNWITYLDIIKEKAKEYNTTARKIEKAIFLAHQIYQDGNLY